jgi:Transcription factor Tfb2
MDKVDVLGFLFQLACLEFGQDYLVESLTETQRTIMEDFKYLGLIYHRKVNIFILD